ncbi:MAG: DUF3179 domain-containing protein [Pseudomonadota bacterium]
MKRIFITVMVLAFATQWSKTPIAAEPPSFYNGFEVEDGLIAPNEIDHGGSGRDGIPSLDFPVFLSGDARRGELLPGDRVMGVFFNGIAKAYPINILEHHEIVNDTFALTPLTITYCPWCGSGMVFKAEAGAQVHQFGVSGLIYNSDMLLYDRETLSLWSQIMKKAVTGPLKGTNLIQVPAQYTNWQAWQEQYPDTLLLSTDTGYDRNYDSSLYAEYRRLPNVRYATLHSDWRIPAKTWVIGIESEGNALALPFSELDKLDGPMSVTVGELPLEVQWDKSGSAARAFDEQGNEFPVTAAYWFAWVAFYPETALFLSEAQN